ncbi:OmpA family protein [Dactylosporangium sp. NPDC050688]|uniref:OmpA family protein n=1 Tax=Dactylosporangium sp. NPDC050688 TaxID=3157217 RepID=UPI0033D4322E
MRHFSRPVAVVLTAGLLLAGCGQDAESTSEPATPARTGACSVPPKPVALAYGARSNNPAPVLPKDVLEVVDQAAYAGNEISAFAVSGAPREVGLHLEFQPVAVNSGAKAAERENLNQQLQEQLGTVRADNAEANPLVAMDLAGRRAGQDGTVVLLDSGLQTVAPLDFHDGNLLSAEPEEVATALKQRDQLPSLKDRTVLLVGIGYTAEPQQTLDTRQRNNLIEIWRAIAKAAGATCVEVYDVAGGDPPATGLPPVSKVTPPAEKPVQVCGTTILANSGRVGFKKNIAVFIDQRAAEQAIGEIADVMRTGSQRAKLIGTTATDQSVEFRAKLSLDRANAVRDVLVRLGISADRIETVGAGTTYRTHVNDIGPNGTLLPGPAAQNRSVVVELSCPNEG